MSSHQPLPVKFMAACALEKILKIPVAKKYIIPGIDAIFKTYLNIMSEIESEDLVCAFENIIAMF